MREREGREGREGITRKSEGGKTCHGKEEGEAGDWGIVFSHGERGVFCLNDLATSLH